MSFSWSASSSPSFTGMKPVATNSFADALKRLAEHVEEKNKNNANNNGTSSLVQSPSDYSNRINPSHVNNSMSPEQALRLYTQYIHEAERRDDMRRSYLRNYGGSDGLNINSPILNRRPDLNDPYRFMAPHLSSPFHPSTYFRSLTQQTRIPPPPSPFLFPNTKSTDTTSRIPTQENTDKQSEQLPQPSKPKLKLFRPYDLDSPNSNSHQTSPIATKKSVSSPLNLPNNTSALPDESQTATSSGKEKQLFNSLGLAQQSTDVKSEKSLFTETSSSITTEEESTPIETILTQQDNHPLSSTKDSSLPITLKRKSSFSSNRKQTKIVPIQNTVE